MPANQLLLKYAKRYPGKIILTVILGFSGAIFNGVSTTLIVPVILSFLGQDVQLAGGPPVIQGILTPFNNFPENYRLGLMTLAILLALLLKNITTYTNTLVASSLGRKLTCDMRESGLQLLLEVDLDFYTKTKVGDMINRLGGEIGRASTTISAYINVFTISVTIFVFLIMLISISWQLTLASIFLLSIVTLSNQWIISKSKYFGQLLSQMSRDYSIKLMEILNGIRLVKATGNEDYEYDHIKKLIREREKMDFISQSVSAALTPINEMVNITILLLLVFLGRTFLAEQQVASLSTILLTYLFVLFRTLPLLSQLNNVRTQLANKSASVEIVNDFLKRDNKPLMQNGTIPYPGIKDRINFNNISFSYPGQTTLTLNKINIQVPRGTTLALVGGSGSGKSTLASLLPRFYDPDTGSVIIDGKNIKEFDVKSLRKQMGIVSQDTFLFNASVRYNIAYARSDATDSKIIEAARRANAYEFIEQLPEGLDTQIGDRGVLLSGGQRQRLSIARALLQNPEILILDEATSALDTVSERLVQEAIDELSRDRTTVVIAHRLSTIQKADQIAVLEKGELIELGTHDELLAKGGQYARLYSMQFADKAERDHAIIRSSYDVRTRLNPMIGFLQLLAEEMIEDSEERLELLNESYHSATHILNSLEFIENSVKLRLKEIE